MVRGFRSVAVPAKIAVSKIDVHVVKRASYATVNVTQTCLVKINYHNITIWPKKIICVFTVTRPTLIFASDPMHFYTEFG